MGIVDGYELMRERASRDEIIDREVEARTLSREEQIRREIMEEVAMKYADQNALISEGKKRLEEERRTFEQEKTRFKENVERQSYEQNLKYKMEYEKKMSEFASQGAFRLEPSFGILTKAVNAFGLGDYVLAKTHLDELHEELMTVNSQFAEDVLSKYKEVESKLLKSRHHISKLSRTVYGKKAEGFRVTDEEGKIIERRLETAIPLTDEEKADFKKASELCRKYRERERLLREQNRVSGKLSHGRNPIPSNLIRLDAEYIIPDEVKGHEAEFEQISCDTHEEVVPIPERYAVRVINRPVYIKKSDESRHPIQASLPASVFWKSPTSVELASQIEVRKYCYHLPFYRQEKMMRSEGYPMNRSTMLGVHERVCDALRPLYEEQKSSVLRSEHLSGDGSPMPMIDNEKHKTVKKYLVQLRSIDTGVPVFFTPPPELFEGNWRGKAVIQYYLKDWTGSAFMCDACSSYDWLKKQPGVTLHRCAYHARREVECAYKEDRLLAEEGLYVFQEISIIEGMIVKEGLHGDAITEYRRNYELPLWEYLLKWCLENIPKLPDGRLIKNAMNYIVRHYEELIAYIDNPAMPNHNNDTESAMRDMVMGKNAYLFCENEQSCENAAMMYSFFGACKVLGKDPERWMTYALKNIPTWPKDRLYELLPENWVDLSN